MAILFEHLFGNIILARGSDYFAEGAVSHLKREHNQIWATVQGTEDYAVYIELKDDGLESLDCSCPYFLGGHNCKHLAAVLYALAQEPRKDGQLEVRSDLSLALEILESLQEEDILDFFGSELERNEDLRTRFLSIYQERGTLSESLLHRQIDSVFQHHLGHGGYIEYDLVDAFSSDVHDIISSIGHLVEEEEYQSAFTLVQHLVEEVSSLEIDDNMGTTTWIMGNLIDIIKRILDEGPDSLQLSIFEWLYPGLREGIFRDHFSEWTDVLMMHFSDEDQLQKKLVLIDEKLWHYEETKLSHRAPMHIYWLAHKLKTLWALGYEEQANQLFNNNLDLPELGLLVVERLLHFGQVEKAMDLLREGKERFKDRWGMADRYSCELMKIHRRLGDRDALRLEGLHRVLEYSPGKLDAYLEYKGMFTPDEWPSERDYILYRLRDKPVDLKSIYAEEELWEELLVALEGGFNHWELERYEELLKNNFPEEFRNLLVQRAIDLAESAGGRKHYIRIRHELQKIAQYPGGTSIVEELKKKWARQYKNRWAMMEELGLVE